MSKCAALAEVGELVDPDDRCVFATQADAQGNATGLLVCIRCTITFDPAPLQDTE